MRLAADAYFFSKNTEQKPMLGRHYKCVVIYEKKEFPCITTPFLKEIGQ
jgi:hypothetical protein